MENCHASVLLGKATFLQSDVDNLGRVAGILIHSCKSFASAYDSRVNAARSLDTTAKKVGMLLSPTTLVVSDLKSGTSYDLYDRFICQQLLSE